MKDGIVPHLAMLLIVVTLLRCGHDAENLGFSYAVSQQIVAEAGLEQAMKLSVSSESTGWQVAPLEADPRLVTEAVALLQSGEGKRMRGKGAPTPEEVWVWELDNGREVLVGWWDVEGAGTVSGGTVTGEVYGDTAVAATHLIRVDRHRFEQLRARMTRAVSTSETRPV